MDKKDSDCFIKEEYCLHVGLAMARTCILRLTHPYGHSRLLTSTLLGLTFFICTTSADLACTWFYFVMVCNRYCYSSALKHQVLHRVLSMGGGGGGRGEAPPSPQSTQLLPQRRVARQKKREREEMGNVYYLKYM